MEPIVSAVKPGSTVIGIRWEEGTRHFSPTAHAFDLLSRMPFIDLRDYEAASDHLLTRFRPDQTPFRSLSQQGKLERPMPRIDIGR